MKTENLLPDIDDISIELSVNDMFTLRDYLRKLESPNCYVEIGTRFGGSALWASKQVATGVEIYSIDHTADLSAFNNQENIANIHFIREPSLVAARSWDKPIGVLFIDADHNQSQQDFGAWEKYVVSGGYILFHDYTAHSPKVITDCETGIVKMEHHFKVLFRPDQESLTSIFQAQKL